MARGDKYTCRTCGKVYDYCEKCQITPEPYKGNGFCSKEHSNIFSILSKHGCGLVTAKETLADLGEIEGAFTSEIQDHIDAIKAETGKQTAETPVVKEEVTEEVVEPTQYSKIKKKW